MICTYGYENGNGREAAWLYQIAFPDRRQPSHSAFAGSVALQTMDQGRPRSAGTPDHNEHILQADDPGISTRQVAIACRTSHSIAYRLRQVKLLCLYHLQRVQDLFPSDNSPRGELLLMVYCTNSESAACFLLTDEETFRKDGIISLHDQHLWADRNLQGRI